MNERKLELMAGRLDDLEALVNGILIHLAAKDAGVALDPTDDRTKEFLTSNVVRPREYRLSSHGAADGHYERVVPERIDRLAQLLKTQFS